MIVTRVVSGGQLGADVGALLGAREAQVSTGGWAPKGWWTEGGSAPWLSTLGLQECPQEGYPARTHANVRDSDGTLIFGNPHSPGCRLTEKYAETLKRPWLRLLWPYAQDRAEAVDAVRYWLDSNRIGTLNVAGNRESMNPGIQEACQAFIRDAFNE